MVKHIVSYSELDSFRQCPLKHTLGYKQRWTKAHDDPDHPLNRGTNWHAVLEAHYNNIAFIQQAVFKGGRIPKDREAEFLANVFQKVSPLFLDSETGEQTPQQELLEWMYAGHLALYGLDRDWLVLDVERKDVVALPSLDGKGKSNAYFLKVKMDLVVKDRLGHILIVDHKSSANLKRKLEVDIDDQFGLYNWAANQLGMEVFATVYSGARTTRNVGDKNGTKLMPLADRFSRVTMYRTATELKNLAMDAARTARATRQPGVPFSSPNPDICKWKCEFLESHLLMRKGTKPVVALTDMGFQQNFTRH